MNEKIYRTPRTYGSPTGYDIELSHINSREARLAEAVLLQMVRADAYRDFAPAQLAVRAGEIAASALNDWQGRGWLLPVEDAPDMKKDYGTKRGEV